MSITSARIGLAAAAFVAAVSGGIFTPGAAFATIAESGSSSSVIPGGTNVAADVSLDDQIVTSDGDVSRGSTKASCGDFAGYGPPLVWSGAYSWIGCSYLGMNSSATKSYSWYVPVWTNGNACTQGLGYNNNAPYWGATGCGTGGMQALKWGNTIACPKFKVKSMTGLGTTTYWK